MGLLGWRIHESVEDTKLSTNKQHTLSSSLLKQKIKGKLLLRHLHRRIFFFKKISVMKCLRSKKRLNAPLFTTLVCCRFLQYQLLSQRQCRRSV